MVYKFGGVGGMMGAGVGSRLPAVGWGKRMMGWREMGRWGRRAREMHGEGQLQLPAANRHRAALLLAIPYPHNAPPAGHL